MEKSRAIRGSLKIQGQELPLATNQRWVVSVISSRDIDGDSSVAPLLWGSRRVAGLVCFLVSKQREQRCLPRHKVGVNMKRFM